MDMTMNEKRLLRALARMPRGELSDPARTASDLGATVQATLQWAQLLAEKGLAVVNRTTSERYLLTAEGEEYALKGLPERQLLGSFESGFPLEELKKNPLARIGIGWMRKKGWIEISGGMVHKTGKAEPGRDERVLTEIAGATAGKSGADGSSIDREAVRDLLKRGVVSVQAVEVHQIRATDEGYLAAEHLDFREETGTLSREQIISGEWKTLPLRRYNIGTRPKKIFPGKIHPYQRLLAQMRQILLEMGFTEIYGGLVQSAFWNFDALFQPQDHPAREMQDTFYLAEKMPLPQGFERVKEMHEHGGTTSSTGWGGRWDTTKAEQCVLRTHTTCLSIRYLADHPAPPVKAFCINRVYRREAIDPTHLPEFEQLEGIVMDRNVSFRHLLGYLKEFYYNMGFESVRFRPGYFPYTEPSVEPEVFVDGLGWVEMGGAGIFRREVTAPWGIDHPVLAWGLGVSRVAMLRMGLKDLRMLYKSDIDLIRETPVHQPGRTGMEVR